MLEDLDFSKLKLPIEPQNLVYIYLAYKLINNLDKLNINGLSGRVMPKPITPVPNNFLFLVLLIIGCSFMFINNIISKVSISSVSMEGLLNQNESFRNRIPRRCPRQRNKSKCPMVESESKCPIQKSNCPIKKCPIFESDDTCPIKKCPLFSNCDSIKEQLERCIQKNTKSEESK